MTTAAASSAVSPWRASLPLVALLVRREFQTRYAGSVLGAAWNVVHPLVMIGVYVLVFSHLMKGRAGAEGTTLDYAIHLTAGILPWFLFAEVVNKGTATLQENANFLRKIEMRPEALHAGVLASACINAAIGFAALVALLALAGQPPGLQIVFALPVMVLLGLFGMGIAMALSVLHLVLRDVAQIVAVGLQLLFWLTPVVYYWSPEVLPAAVMEGLRYNPVLPFVSLVQRLFGSPGHGWSGGPAIHLLFVLPLASVVLGSWFLRRHRAEILDEL